MADSPRIDELQRRVQMDPASIAFAALAEEYRRAGQFDDAMATCTEGLRRHPAYISAHVTLGRTLVAVGRLGDARVEFAYVLELAPENLAAIRGLAEIHNVADSSPRSAPTHPPVSGAATALENDNAEMSSGGFTESSPVADASIAHQTVGEAPALGGLEEFLGAIARARTGRMLVT
jgi:tetratricopeptide (TPR) repeat protein